MVTKTKLIKTKINPKIKKFAKNFNIQFRVGATPDNCNIVCNDKIPSSIPAVYFGEGIIYVRDNTPLCKEDMDLVCLHEVSHAIIDLFPLNKKYLSPLEESFANMMSLCLAAQLRLPVSDLILRNYDKYNKITSKRIS